MSSCRDSRDNIPGTTIPSIESSSSGDIPYKGIPPTTTTRKPNRRKLTSQNHPEYSDWRPTWATLPDAATLERPGLEVMATRPLLLFGTSHRPIQLSQPGGVPTQRRLWDDALPDDSKAARLARILATCPVTTGDSLPTPGIGGQIVASKVGKTVDKQRALNPSPD
jgi:hypothetical protein